MSARRTIEGIGFFEWLELIKRVVMSKPSVKLVAMTLGSYADYGDGKNARPGVAKLMAVTGTSKSTVLRSLAELEELGLIEKTARGQSKGRNGGGYASEYRLTMPSDLLSRATVLGLDGKNQVSPELPDSHNQVSDERPHSENQMPDELPDYPLNQVPNDENQVSFGSNQVSKDENQVPPMTPHILTYTSSPSHPHASPESLLTSARERSEREWLSLSEQENGLLQRQAEYEAMMKAAQAAKGQTA